MSRDAPTPNRLSKENDDDDDFPLDFFLLEDDDDFGRLLEDDGETGRETGGSGTVSDGEGRGGVARPGCCRESSWSASKSFARLVPKSVCPLDFCLLDPLPAPLPDPLSSDDEKSSLESSEESPQEPHFQPNQWVTCIKSHWSTQLPYTIVFVLTPLQNPTLQAYCGTLQDCGVDGKFAAGDLVGSGVGDTDGAVVESGVVPSPFELREARKAAKEKDFGGLVSGTVGDRVGTLTVGKFVGNTGARSLDGDRDASPC